MRRTRLLRLVFLRSVAIKPAYVAAAICLLSTMSRAHDPVLRLAEGSAKVYTNIPRAADPKEPCAGETRPIGVHELMNLGDSCAFYTPWRMASDLLRSFDAENPAWLAALERYGLRVQMVSAIPSQNGNFVEGIFYADSRLDQIAAWSPAVGGLAEIFHAMDAAVKDNKAADDSLTQQYSSFGVPEWRADYYKTARDPKFFGIWRNYVSSVRSDRSLSLGPQGLVDPQELFMEAGIYYFGRWRDDKAEARNFLRENFPDLYNYFVQTLQELAAS